MGNHPRVGGIVSATFTCDGCGKSEPAMDLTHGSFKPRDWYERTVYFDAEGNPIENHGLLATVEEQARRRTHRTQHACSRACIKMLGDGLVLPI